MTVVDGFPPRIWRGGAIRGFARRSDVIFRLVGALWPAYDAGDASRTRFEDAPRQRDSLRGFSAHIDTNYPESGEADRPTISMAS